MDGGVTFVPQVIFVGPFSNGIPYTVSGYWSHVRAVNVEGVATGLTMQIASEPNPSPSVGSEDGLVMLSQRAVSDDTTNYIANGGFVSFTNSLIMSTPMPIAGTLKNFRMRIVANNNLVTTTFTLHKNGVATAMVISVGASATGSFSDLVNTVAFVAGDTFALTFSGTGGGNIDMAATIEFEPA
jgi:hypothetical protein